MEQQDRLLSEREAAKMLGLAPGTLRVQRCQGPREGRLPWIPFLKLGRSVRYQESVIRQIVAGSKVGQ